MGDPVLLFSELHRGRLHVGLGLGRGGICLHHRADASARDELWIALGGPIASLLMAAGAIAGLLLIGGWNAPTAAGTVLAAFAVVNVLAVASSLRPDIVPAHETNIGGAVPNDGMLIAHHLGLVIGPPAPREYTAVRSPILVALVLGAIPRFTIDKALSLVMLAIGVWLHRGEKQDARRRAQEG